MTVSPWPSKNATLVTVPGATVAEALIVKFVVTVAPLAGLVMDVVSEDELIFVAVMLSKYIGPGAIP